MKTPRTLKKVSGHGRQGYTAVYQTDDGRFTATGGVGNRQGTSYNWTLYDKVIDRHIRCRTLEECREEIRVRLDEEESL